MAKSWQKADITYLKRYAKNRTAAELVERFGREQSQVEDKLKELGLTSKDNVGAQEPYIDPTLGDFEKALQAFHGQKWAQAEKLFETVAASAEQANLAATAREYSKACTERLSEGGGTPEDPFLEAVMAKNAGDLEHAADLCSRGGRRGKDERFAYLAASVLALEGKSEEALEQLQASIKMNPENRVHAFHDPDFDSIRSAELFDQLILVGEA